MDKKYKVYEPPQSFPNQKKCTIDKPKYKEEGVKFMYIGIEEIRNAAKVLSPSALKLYLYFAENEAGWKFYLSPKDFYKSYGVAESTYRNAKVELIKNGYIIEEEGKNCFTFFTTPRNEVLDIVELKKELNLIGNKLKDENINIYNKYFEKIKSYKELPEDEKYYRIEQLLKEMKRDLDNIYKEKDAFDI